MKATRSGHKWAHVACAIWIPEVSIGSVEKMEPITKISSIPVRFWLKRNEEDDQMWYVSLHSYCLCITDQQVVLSMRPL